MPRPPNTGFVRVDDLLPQVSLEQVAAYYGVELPELKRTGDEIRTRCFLNCGRTEPTSDRALAIQAETAGKVWRCFAQGCHHAGNLLGILDLLAPGEHMHGKPRGERFKELARDLQAIVEGHTRVEPAAPQKTPADARKEPPRNLPLAAYENERARELVSLDEQFIYPDQLEAMSPAASRYFRQRAHFLSADVCRQFRVGYLPQSAKSLLRGKIVYPYFDAHGNLLTWFGRDPAYDEKRRRWSASDRSETEPQKFQFVKGFQRGLELWGEHVVRLGTGSHDRPLVIVEGPNDCMRLQVAGIPALAICAASMTAEQVERIVALSREVSTAGCELLLDCDEEGETGAKHALWELTQHVPVRPLWSRHGQERRFANRQPEQLSPEELAELFAFSSGPYT